MKNAAIILNYRVRKENKKCGLFLPVISNRHESGKVADFRRKAIPARCRNSP
jgi:hypothetical protein